MLAAVVLVVGALWIFLPVEPRYQGNTLQGWFDQFKGYDGDPVAQTLRDIGPDSVSFLAKRMVKNDSFLNTQYVALWPKLPAFVKSRLKRPNTAAEKRVKAVGALRQMGSPFTDSEAGLAALTTALNHPDIEVRSRAEGALGDLGPQARTAVPALIKSVEQRTRTSTGHMDINGIWALGRIGPDAKPALPLLEALLKEKDGRELVYAAEAILKIGGDKAGAISALQRALDDEDQQARREAATVLAQTR